MIIFNISDMFPSLIAMNGNKKAYQNLKTAFDQSSISSFLKDMLAGKSKNFKYENEPVLDKEIGHMEL